MNLPAASLRNKITLGYTLAATLFILLVLFTFTELRLFEENIETGAQINDFFDATLEIRRFEKNYFLYHQPPDYSENRQYVAQATRLLQENPAMFHGLPAPPLDLIKELARYAGLMEQYWQQRDPALALRIRESGKRLVDSAEQLARGQRVLQRQALARQRQILLFSALALIVAALALGRWLSWHIVQPLRRMEAGLKAIAEGSRDKLEMPGHDREIALLIEAVNRMIEEIEVRQHHLMRSEKLAALGTLLSGVAHELNNPLSNISTSCQILQEESGDIDPEFQRELLDQIDGQTGRARNIVRALLDFTRVREFQREILELNNLLKETVQFLKGQLPTQLDLALEVPAGIHVEGDKQRLQQVFLNLLKNAIEAAGEYGEVRLRAVYVPRQAICSPAKSCLDQDGARIEILDNGAGIPPAVLPRIFDPFFTTKEVGHGVGLGLFIAHEIIEEHGGCISADNRPEGGAVFTIWLPADRENLRG